MRINWNFLRGGECKTKNLPWGEYGYFLELHIITIQRPFSSLENSLRFVIMDPYRLGSKLKEISDVVRWQ